MQRDCIPLMTAISGTLVLQQTQSTGFFGQTKTMAMARDS